MRTLIIGGSSLLGRYLLKTKPHDIDIALTWNKNISGVADILNIWYKLDIRNRADVFEIFEFVRPNLVILCAAIGGVDHTQSHYQEVFEVNVTGVQNVVDAANGYKTKVIYISSNAVYSGNNPPYNEKMPLEPVNSYGVIKRQAERVIRDMAKKWLIIRPFLMYGYPYLGGRTNWVVSIMDGLSSGKQSYKLVNDHIWQPTYALEVAQTIWQLHHQNEEVYNVASSERATLYEFGLKVCEVFGLEKNLVQPVNSDFFPTIAPRPKDTSYDLVKLSSEGIMLSDIKTGLEKMRVERSE